MVRLVIKRLRRARGDRGMTLVETLIAAVLLVIVIGLSTGSLMFALGKQSNISQATDAATQTQNAMELVSRVIRQGVYPASSTNSTIIQTATPTQLVVTSRLSNSYSVNPSQMDTAKMQYTFTLTGTTLVWQQATVSCTGAGVCTYGTPSAQKVLIRGVRNTSGASACSGNTSWSDGPFHYVTLNATTGVPDQTGVGAGTVTGTDLNRIGFVQLNFFTQTQTGIQRPACTPLSDYVELRNKA